MAQLTDQLSSINDGKPIINPGPEGPSWLSGLVNFGEAVLGGTLDRADRADARSRQERADRLDEALDVTEQRLFDMGQTRDVFNANSDINVTLPVWQNGRLDQRIQSILTAEEQGSINASMRDMQFETLVSEMYQLYPEARAEIANYLQGRGVRHAGLRAEIDRQQMLEADSDARRGALTTQYEWAASRGLIDDSVSLADGAAVGRRGMEAVRQVEAAQAAAEAAREAEELNESERDRILEQSQGDLVNALGYQLNVQINPHLDRLTNLLAAAGSDPERQQLTDQARTQTQIALETWRREAHQQIWSMGGPNVQDSIEMVDGIFDQRIEQMNAMFDGSFEQNSRAASNFAAAMGMERDQVLPLYTALSDAFGAGAANGLLSGPDGTIELPDDIVEALRREIRLYDPSSRDGSSRLARFIAYARGEQGLQDLTPQQARQWFDANVRLMLSNVQAYSRGDEAALERWTPQYINAVEAARELPPTTTDARSLHAATGVVASGQARNMLSELDDDLGTAALQASRAGAQHLYQVARDQHSAPQGGWRIVYRDGVHRLTPPSQADYEAFVRAQPQMYEVPGPDGTQLRQRSFPSYAEFVRQRPENLRLAVDVLNGNLTHLALTRDSEEWARGLTERQYRDFIATGRLPEGVERGSVTATADEQFGTMIDQYIDDISQSRFDTTQLPDPPAPRPMSGGGGGPYNAVYGHGRYAQPPRPVTEMTLSEVHHWGQSVLVPATRGHLPNQDENTGTSAVGAYQFIGPTLARAAEAVFGEDWREVQFTPENQDRMGEWLFNNARSSIAALRNEWEGLTYADAQRIVSQNLSWEQARDIIFDRESQ